MPTWTLIHSHDWTADSATSAGAANSTTGAGDGGKWTDLSGGIAQIDANAVGSLSMLRFNDGSYNGPTLAYDPTVEHVKQKVVLRIPPTPTANTNAANCRYHFDPVANSSYTCAWSLLGTVINCNIYSVQSGSLTHNFGNAGGNWSYAGEANWYDLETVIDGDGTAQTTITNTVYNCSGPTDLPASGSVVGSGTLTDTASDFATGPLQGQGAFGFSFAGNHGLAAAAWLYQGDTSSSFTASPTTVTTSLSGQAVTLTGTGTSWTTGTPWAFSGGTITNVNTVSATSVILTVTGGSSTGTFGISDGTSSAAVTLAAASPITAGTASVTSYGPSAVKVRTTAPAGGSGTILSDLYGSTTAFFAPPGVGTLIASSVPADTDVSATPSGTGVQYYRFRYHDSGSSPVLSGLVQAVPGYARRGIIAVGTSVTSRLGAAVGDAVQSVCGPLVFSVTNAGASGSTIADWQKGNASGFYASAVSSITGSSLTTLWFEMGTNDLSYDTAPDTLYSAFLASCRQFLADIAADCPTLTEVLLNTIPFYHKAAVDVASSAVTAARGANLLAGLARFQSYPDDLAGTYANAVAKPGDRRLYGATAADATLIDATDHIHPSTAGMEFQKQLTAAAYRDAFVSPASGGFRISGLMARGRS